MFGATGSILEPSGLEISLDFSEPINRAHSGLAFIQLLDQESSEHVTTVKYTLVLSSAFRRVT